MLVNNFLEAKRGSTIKKKYKIRSQCKHILKNISIKYHTLNLARNKIKNP